MGIHIVDVDIKKERGKKKRKKERRKQKEEKSGEKRQIFMTWGSCRIW